MNKNNLMKILFLILLITSLSGCYYYPLTENTDPVEDPIITEPENSNPDEVDTTVQDEELAKLTAQIEELQSEITVLTDKVASYETDILEYEEQITALESSNQTSTELIESLKKEKATLTETVATLNAQINTLSDTVDALETQLETMQVAINQLNDAKAVLEVEKANLERDLNQLYDLFFQATTEVIKGNIMVKEFNSTKFGVVQSISQGSGVIIKEDATKYYVLTNNHVVYGDPSLPNHSYKVYDYKMNEYVATLLLRSADYDLALLSFAKKDEVPLKVMPLANQNPINGDLVIAFGHPEGQVNAITFGEAIRYQQPNVLDQPLLSNVQFECTLHDAYIDNGNSGGMLVNENFEVVGINTFGTTNNTYAYSVPVQKVREYLQSVNFSLS